MKSLRRILFLSAAAALAIAFWVLPSRKALTEEQPNPSLTSDKADYEPGEIATLTGAGFQPQESIQLSLSIDQPVTGLHIGDSN